LPNLLATGQQGRLGWAGVGTAVLGLLGMFRNVTGAVAPIAALNNYLLPAFMIALGVALMRWTAIPELPASEHSAVGDIGRG
jgi:hypothetical protein